MLFFFMLTDVFVLANGFCFLLLLMSSHVHMPSQVHGARRWMSLSALPLFFVVCVCGYSE